MTEPRFLRRWIALLVLAALAATLSGCEGYDARKQAFLEKGQELFEAGDDARARLELRNALQIDNKLAQAWYLLGRIEERAGEPAKALKNYTRALELDPGFVDARVRRAHFLIGSNRLDRAEEDLEVVLTQEPGNLGALVARSALRQRQGDIEGAEKDAREVLSRDATHAGASALLASLLVAREDVDAAIATLRAAIADHENELGLKLMLGRIYDQEGNTEGAIDVLRSIVATQPDEFAYRTRLANYYASLQRIDEAESVLRDGLAQSPDDLDRQRALLRLLLRARGLEAARRELAVMRARQPNDTALQFIEAEMALAAGDAATAEAVYEEILRESKTGPSAIRARNALAQRFIAGGRDDAAREQVEAVLAESSREPDALQLRAVLALRRDDVAQAIADLRSVLRDHPDRVQAHRLLGQAHAKADDYALAQDAFEKAIELAPDEPAAYLELAEVRVRTGDADGAAATLDRLLQRVPDNAAAQEAISRLQMTRQDWQALAQSAARIKLTRPEHPLGHYLEGLALQQQGRHEEAIPSFDRALALRTDAIEPLVALSRSELALQRPGQAEQRVKSVLEAAPNNVFALNLLADIYLATGKEGEAFELYREIIAFHPKSPRGYARLAQLQSAKGDRGSTRATLEQGIEATGRSTLLLMRYAFLLEQLGELDGAVDAYEEVLRTHPDSAVAANNLAVLLTSRVEDPRALARALELAERFRESDVPEFVDTLGWVHHVRGDHATAAAYLERAVAAKPELPEIRFHMGMNLVALGRIDEALEHLSFAASAEDYAQRAAAKRMLDSLGRAIAP